MRASAQLDRLEELAARGADREPALVILELHAEGHWTASEMFWRGVPGESENVKFRVVDKNEYLRSIPGRPTVLVDDMIVAED